MNKPVERVEGFSKLDQIEKRELVASVLENPKDVMDLLQSFAHPDAEIQELLNEFSENTLTNFPLPYCIAPNFKIDGQNYLVPMVIEESSVVAAASNAAKFWFDKGGFRTEIVNTEKVGQVHFIWNDDVKKLTDNFASTETRANQWHDGYHRKHAQPWRWNFRHRFEGFFARRTRFDAAFRHF